MKIYSDDLKEFAPWALMIIAFIFIAIESFNRVLALGFNSELLGLCCGLSMIISLVLMVIFWIADI